MTEFKTQKDSPLPQDPQDESPEERQRFDADMKEKMEENFRDTREDLDNVDSGIVPIGSIIPWHKSLTGAPDLPESFLECDGSVIDDSESPMDGETLPDLNGDERFLRGHDTTSGTEQLHAFQGHFHQYQGRDSQVNGNNQYLTHGGSGDIKTSPIVASYVGVADDGVHGTPNVESETRPINMSVIMVMRIK